jgi:hypothetical protein
MRPLLANVELDAFSASQTSSKIWLVRELEQLIDSNHPGYIIWLLAGWYGITNYLIRARGCIPILEVRSFDSDPECEPIADRINNLWEWQNWQFKAFTRDINDIDWATPPDIVINTSVEHLDRREWFWEIPRGTLIALQASDLEHDDHVAEYTSQEDLAREFPLEETMFVGTRKFRFDNGLEFSRFMIIGRK